MSQLNLLIFMVFVKVFGGPKKGRLDTFGLKRAVSVVVFKRRSCLRHLRPQVLESVLEGLPVPLAPHPLVEVTG